MTIKTLLTAAALTAASAIGAAAEAVAASRRCPARDGMIYDRDSGTCMVVVGLTPTIGAARTARAASAGRSSDVLAVSVFLPDVANGVSGLSPVGISTASYAARTAMRAIS